MGFEAKRRTYTLDFEDDLDGLEVVCRAPTVKEALTGINLEWMLQHGELDADAYEAKLRELYAIFVGRLDSWNLEDEGIPVETTLESLLDLDNDFATRIIRAWLRNTTGLSAPLDQDSSDGERFPEESIPVETLSPSLAS